MHAGFLSAIMATPDDDQPRLICADWLEEQGNARGEFIRVQCEIAKREARLQGREAEYTESTDGEPLLPQHIRQELLRVRPELQGGCRWQSRGWVDIDRPWLTVYCPCMMPPVSLRVFDGLPPIDSLRTFALRLKRFVHPKTRTSRFPDTSPPDISSYFAGMCPECHVVYWARPLSERGQRRAVFAPSPEQEQLDALRTRERELLTPWNILAWTCRDPREMPVIGKGEPQCQHVGHGRITLTGAYFDAVTFRRGFIESVECGAEKWILHGQTLRELHPVSEVVLGVISNNVNLTSLVSNMENLHGMANIKNVMAPGGSSRLAIGFLPAMFENARAEIRFELYSSSSSSSSVPGERPLRSTGQLRTSFAGIPLGRARDVDVR